MKYVRVMDGLKSNAGGFEYKLDEINIASFWNKNKLEPEKMGGFNYGVEDKILRWLHRGDTIYDVIIPSDAEVVLCNEEKGVYRSNKIIVTNPRPITDKLVIELVDKTTLSDKVLAECLVTLLWKNRVEISKYIIKTKVNKNNIDEILEQFIEYAGDDNLNSNTGKDIYEILKEIKNPLDISLYVTKDNYEKQLTNDNIINLAGQTGSGKSYYAKEHFNNDNYLVVDTDEVLSEKRFINSTGINKELGTMFRNKYKTLPELSDNFDLIYNEILDYCKKYDKCIVIDCAQFHCVKDINILKGKIIIIRTDIETCYNRTINRWIKNNPSYSIEELNKFKERKKGIYSWYKYTNEFINKIDKKNNIIIREASKDNIEEVAKLHVDSWYETYKGIIEEDYLINMKNNLNKRIERMKNEFTLRKMIVALINDEIVGFMEYSLSNEFSKDLDIDCELCGLYIKNNYKEKGIGSKLFNYVVEIFKKNNKTKMGLWCIKENINAINFYKNKGGKIIKEKQITINNKDYYEVAFIYNFDK